MNHRYRILGFLFVLCTGMLVVQQVRAQQGWSIQDTLDVDFAGDRVSYQSIAAFDTLHCIAAGWSGTGHDIIRRTTDGGQHWQTVRSDQFKGYKYPDLAYPTVNLCIAVGYGGAIMRTTDGGETWQKISCDASYSVPGKQMALTSISMADSIDGVVAGFSEVLLRTKDGGGSWQRIPFPPDPVPGAVLVCKDIRCLGPEIYVALTQLIDAPYTPYAHRTEDGGMHWTRVETDTIGQCTFTDSLHGCGVGTASNGGGSGGKNKDIIQRTSDGGRSWSTVVRDVVEPAFGLDHVSFADAEHGVATGGSGKVTWTRDRGRTWQPGPDLDVLFHVLNMSGVTYPHQGWAWATSVQGQILHYQDSTSIIGGVDNSSIDIIPTVAVWPNPFADRSIIRLDLPWAAHLRLELYDVRGNLIRKVLDERRTSGEHQVMIDGSTLPVGAYWYHLWMAKESASGSQSAGGGFVIVR
ncbi:MAG: YCF48-related protein [Bacteroidota bacterium]